MDDGRGHGRLVVATGRSAEVHFCVEVEPMYLAYTGRFRPTTARWLLSSVTRASPSEVAGQSSLLDSVSFLGRHDPPSRRRRSHNGDQWVQRRRGHAHLPRREVAGPLVEMVQYLQYRG